MNVVQMKFLSGQIQPSQFRETFNLIDKGLKQHRSLRNSRISLKNAKVNRVRITNFNDNAKTNSNIKKNELITTKLIYTMEKPIYNCDSDDEKHTEIYQSEPIECSTYEDALEPTLKKNINYEIRCVNNQAFQHNQQSNLDGQMLNNPSTNIKVDQKISSIETQKADLKNCSIETQTMDPLLCIQLYKSTIKLSKQRDLNPTKDLNPFKEQNLLFQDCGSTGKLSSRETFNGIQLSKTLKTFGRRLPFEDDNKQEPNSMFQTILLKKREEIQQQSFKAQNNLRKISNIKSNYGTRNNSVPFLNKQEKDMKMKIDFLKITKMPNQWNDNYYQSFKMIAIEEKKLIETQKRLKEQYEANQMTIDDQIFVRSKYQDSRIPIKVQETKLFRSHNPLNKDLGYGTMNVDQVALQFSKGKKIFKEEPFDASNLQINLKNSRLEGDDYFHAYVQNQKK